MDECSELTFILPHWSDHIIRNMCPAMEKPGTNLPIGILSYRIWKCSFQPFPTASNTGRCENIWRRCDHMNVGPPQSSLVRNPAWKFLKDSHLPGEPGNNGCWFASHLHTVSTTPYWSAVHDIWYSHLVVHNPLFLHKGKMILLLLDCFRLALPAEIRSLQLWMCRRSFQALFKNYTLTWKNIY